MSQVMTTNKVEVRYPFSKGYIESQWIQTGQFVGYGKTEVLDCDTEHKRQLIVALGWHLEDLSWTGGSIQKVIGSPWYALNINEVKGDRKTYDHMLTVDEMWHEIELMVDEIHKDEKHSAEAIVDVIAEVFQGVVSD